jgi:hypothetical protein
MAPKSSLLQVDVHIGCSPGLAVVYTSIQERDVNWPLACKSSDMALNDGDSITEDLHSRLLSATVPSGVTISHQNAGVGWVDLPLDIVAEKLIGHPNSTEPLYTSAKRMLTIRAEACG